MLVFQLKIVYLRSVKWSSCCVYVVSNVSMCVPVSGRVVEWVSVLRMIALVTVSE